MSMRNTALGVATTTPPTADDQMGHDMEKSGSGLDGHREVPQDFREKDFMTRNGLNLRSFTRRKQPAS